MKYYTFGVVIIIFQEVVINYSLRSAIILLIVVRVGLKLYGIV